MEVVLTDLMSQNPHHTRKNGDTYRIRTFRAAKEVGDGHHFGFSCLALVWDGSGSFPHIYENVNPFLLSSCSQIGDCKPRKMIAAAFPHDLCAQTAATW